MANINIEIPDELHKRLKLAALLRDSTLKQFLVDRLGEKAATPKKTIAAQRVSSARRRVS